MRHWCQWLAGLAGWAAAILVWGFMVEQSHAQTKIRNCLFPETIAAILRNRGVEAGFDPHKIDDPKETTVSSNSWVDGFRVVITFDGNRCLVSVFAMRLDLLP